MFLYLRISSKDQKTFQKLACFFQNLEFLPVFLKSFSKQRKRKVITVLQSPHVNKTAQEQFEYRVYSKDLLIHSFKPLTFFLLLKKLKNRSFPGLNLKIRGLFEKKNFYKHTLQIITPDNISLKNKKRKKARNLKTVSKTFQANHLLTQKYIQLFDLSGEIYLQKLFYF